MNFQEFEELINSGLKEITLTEDVILEDSEREDYMWGVEITADDLIIDGNNHAVNGNKKASLLNVESRVTLRNFRFENACFEYSGGALINRGDLIIENCEFFDNTSWDLGGAIYNEANLTIKNSKFMENRAEYGGAIFMDSDSMLSLSGSVFESNFAEFEGGAIYNKSKLSVYDCLFRKNAAYKGGAIYNELILNVRDSEFTGNIAGDDNDDIRSESEEKLSVFNCIFD